MCGNASKEDKCVTAESDGFADGKVDSDSVRIDNPDNFAPQEDGYQRLWTPQRMMYVLGNSKKNNAEKNNAGKNAKKACPFCEGPKKSDEDGLIVWRGKNVFAIMNLYPYNCGHLMICPYEHVNCLSQLNEEQMLELTKATAMATDAMQEVSNPDGFNIGINQGEAGGAGVAAHLHEHIVPRWNGDSNFMPIIAQTRTMPVLLENQRSAYSEAFDKFAQVCGL